MYVVIGIRPKAITFPIVAVLVAPRRAVSLQPDRVLGPIQLVLRFPLPFSPLICYYVVGKKVVQSSG